MIALCRAKFDSFHEEDKLTQQNTQLCRDKKKAHEHLIRLMQQNVVNETAKAEEAKRQLAQQAVVPLSKGRKRNAPAKPPVYGTCVVVQRGHGQTPLTVKLTTSTNYCSFTKELRATLDAEINWRQVFQIEDFEKRVEFLFQSIQHERRTRTPTVTIDDKERKNWRGAPTIVDAGDVLGDKCVRVFDLRQKHRNTTTALKELRHDHNYEELEQAAVEDMQRSKFKSHPIRSRLLGMDFTITQSTLKPAVSVTVVRLKKWIREALAEQTSGGSVLDDLFKAVRNRPRTEVETVNITPKLEET
jgi:hypothetical protein